MKIHKISHCCLVIDVQAHGQAPDSRHAGHERRILLDPGSFSVEKHSKVNKIDIVLITHEHADHFHIESLKALLNERPEIRVIANDTVGAILAKEGVPHHVMGQGDAIDLLGVHIEAYGKDHAILHSSLPLMSNIGFLIEEKMSPSVSHAFFFPGDALTAIDKRIDVLALPIVGPWMKISEAIDYALEMKPKKAIPVHDGGSPMAPFMHSFAERLLGPRGIEFIKLEDGGEILYS
jgi:L-ascorbate metabolism protein UlaG (beta-lactamase superfamily)